MAVTYQIEEYKNYGKVVAITNGAVELKVTIDIGPRVIYFALVNGQNVMFNDDRRDITVGKGEAIFEAEIDPPQPPLRRRDKPDVARLDVVLVVAQEHLAVADEGEHGAGVGLEPRNNGDNNEQ